MILFKVYYAQKVGKKLINKLNIFQLYIFAVYLVYKLRGINMKQSKY